MFRDEFDGSAVDESKWQYRSTAESDWSDEPYGTGNPGSKQLEFDHPGNCSVDDGALTITARPDGIQSESGNWYEWSSCLITSTGPQGHTFRYGYIEIRATLPSRPGFWPSFWTWQSADNEQPTEADVFEYFSDNRRRLYHSWHSDTDQTCIHAPRFDPSAGMNVYGADIRESGTNFYINGAKVCHAAGKPAGPVNLVVSNFVYAGVPPESGSAGRMVVDYVRAWQRSESHPAHLPPTSSPSQRRPVGDGRGTSGPPPGVNSCPSKGSATDSTAPSVEARTSGTHKQKRTNRSRSEGSRTSAEQKKPPPSCPTTPSSPQKRRSAASSRR
ncbi:glycoside hydrolase family 16 protein [Nonomuraea sp. NPDC049152]|uniref:glycoside hydrolase family 16 protein n=1 Tax=Nonomuraea sp. NPDC049152 TaxID=3154350 RepID=UPI0033D3226F